MKIIVKYDKVIPLLLVFGLAVIQTKVEGLLQGLSFIKVELVRLLIPYLIFPTEPRSIYQI